MECVQSLVFQKQKLPLFSTVALFSIQYLWCKVQRACYCCRVPHLGELESRELLKSLFFVSEFNCSPQPSQRLWVLHYFQTRVATGFFCTVCCGLSLSGRWRMRLNDPLTFLYAEPQYTCATRPERASVFHLVLSLSLLCSLPLLLFIVSAQSATINKSAKAFSESQCERFLPSNCLKTNISFTLSHEKSVSSPFQIANFAPRFLVFVSYHFPHVCMSYNRARRSSFYKNVSKSLFPFWSQRI